MSITIAELKAKLTADTKDFDSGLKRAQSEATNFDKALGGLAKGGLGKLAGAAAGAFAVDKIIQFGNASIQAASNLTESLNKSNTVFGQSAAQISAWAQGAAKDFGLSQRAALDAAGTFGNLFVQLGFNSDEAANVSKQITELAADFASFHNADIEQVIQAQTAAFRGEYDSLQRFLPLINAATVEQRAMEMTGKKNASALTAQEKAAAVTALMFEGAGDAAGDFDRTSGGLANQQRTLTAQLEDTQATLGKKLQPVMLQVVSWLNSDGIPGFLKLAEVIGEGMADAVAFAVGGLADFASAIGQVLEKVDQFIPGMEGVPEDIMAGVDVLRDWEASLHDVQINLDLATGATEESTDATKATLTPTKNAAQALKEQAESAKKAHDAMVSLKDANFALEDSQISAADVQKELNDLLASGGVDAEKVADATKDLARAQDDLTSANKTLASAQEDYNEALADAGEKHLKDVKKATDDLREAQKKLADETQDVADAEAKLAKLKAQRQARDEAIKQARAQLTAADSVTERIIAQEALSKALGMEIVTDEELAAAQSDVAVQQGEVKTAVTGVDDAQQALNATLAEAPEQSDSVKNAAERLKTAQDGVKSATNAAVAAQSALNAAQQPAPGYAQAVEAAQRTVERANWDVEKATWAAQRAQAAYNDALRSQPAHVVTSKTINETINTTRNEKINFNFSMIGLPSAGSGAVVPLQMRPTLVMHDGGVVPGPRGSEVPAMLQAGEQVIPAGGAGAGGGDQTIIVRLEADGKVIQEILLAHQRRSGPLGFRQN